VTAHAKPLVVSGFELSILNLLLVVLGLIVKLSVDRALVPKQLVAVILNVYIPGVLAVPLNTPLILSKVIPGGKTSVSHVPIKENVPVPETTTGAEDVHILINELADTVIDSVNPVLQLTIVNKAPSIPPFNS